MNTCIYITFLCEPFCTGIKCVGCSESDGNLNGHPYFAFSWAPTLRDLGTFSLHCASYVVDMQHEGVKCVRTSPNWSLFACCEERVCTSQ